MADPSFTTASSCAVALTANMTCLEVSTGMTCYEFNQKWFQSVQETPLGEKCVSDPFEVQFVYNGGDCNQTLAQLDVEVDCQDLLGGPPTSRGEPSWVEISSTSGRPGNIYFSEVIYVGDTFNVTMPDTVESFADTVNIDIYEAKATTEEESATRGALLQRVQLPFDCKMGNIGGLDRYGAFQFVGYASTEQGYQYYYSSSEATISMNLSVELTNSNTNQQIQLTELNVATNFAPFFFDLTEYLPPGGVPFGDTLALDFQGEADMTRESFRALVSWEETTQDGESCPGTELLEFAFEEFPSIFDDDPTNTTNVEEEEEEEEEVDLEVDRSFP